MRMHIRAIRPLSIAAMMLAACSDPVVFEHSDVDAAREAWLDANFSDYRFEVAIATSWVPQSGFYQVRVRDGEVIAAWNADGDVVSLFTLTVDQIWDELLAARDAGQLNSATFDHRGVPLETDFGPWPVDGGVHYSVRNFRPDG